MVFTMTFNREKTNNNTTTMFHLKRLANTKLRSPTANSNKTATVCCDRLQMELKYPPFNTTDPFTDQPLDGPNTVGPSTRGVLLIKSIILGWSLSVFVTGIITYSYPAFYFAYLTNDTLVVTCVYFLTSWLNTLHYTCFTFPGNNTQFTAFHKLTWGLFALAAPAEIVVTVGYWTLVWDGTSSAFTYRNLMIHGGFMLIVLLEGLVINRIPIRLRHFWLVAAYLILYLAWTVLHALLGIGNPETDDDLIYTALQWKNEPGPTTLVGAEILFVLAPVAFLTVCLLSSWSCPCGCDGSHRRYATTPMDGEDGQPFVEMKNTVLTEV